MPGGTALGAVLLLRNNVTAAMMTIVTAKAIEAAANQARRRWRLRRVVLAMLSC
ncbi:hypothetical protein Mkiyose1665_48240 [Mycobacterium kiyosense]|uniref:Uncharacterized protein n=1 Tax=Mycobacterium kiyosense TaxID=2871094 RepID=A0A9P3UW96_9MYCO|nr:hypothetical protein IWGMT90018_61490 [Mycobacterium kiyosense]BDE11317.1 hypothetical protein MKCMC460_01770 [Mycobacterium sp. 20KCMC460]GLB91278.1 hypothetical protein SRL2020130_40950 [Mycobacterium kiyosense]GLC02505.1 hypothetical protein SRL2020400_30960 [Mycobacterium kiyosense]GLC09644.1 hypothetical protein SRL2020411_42900 [Mycobacterium kiyosense]